MVGHILEKVPFDLFVYRRIIILELDSEKRKKKSQFVLTKIEYLYYIYFAMPPCRIQKFGYED